MQCLLVAGVMAASEKSWGQASACAADEQGEQRAGPIPKCPLSTPSTRLLGEGGWPRALHRGSYAAGPFRASPRPWSLLVSEGPPVWVRSILIYWAQGGQKQENCIVVSSVDS